MTVPIVIRTFEVIDVMGFDFKFYLCRGQDNNKVVLVGGRQTGGNNYHPIIEMDIDSMSFYKDVNSGLISNNQLP